jgi:hypothetical protein
MRKIITLAVLLLCFSSFSQDSISSSILNFQEVQPSGWNTYVSNAEFEIQYQFIECDPEVGYDHEALILKIENKTSTIIDLDWLLHIYRADVCKTCAYPVEYARTIQLAPNEIIEGSCDRDTNKQLKIFSKYIDQDYSKGLHLSGFQLYSLTITIAE